MKKILQKVIPKFLKRKLVNMALAWVEENNKKKSGEIPKYNLLHKHIASSKLITNRNCLLELLPKEGIVAELGVDEGGFSEIIFNTCKPRKLHLIDFWGSERYNQNKRNGVQNKFNEPIKNGIVEINIGLSTEVVHQFQDSYFDWIYIDTTHSYKTTIQELELYKSKIKEKGIIAGHDYTLGNWNRMVRYGVIEAVSEFCIKYDWEIIFLTVDNPPSFAIRRINAGI